MIWPPIIRTHSTLRQFVFTSTFTWCQGNLPIAITNSYSCVWWVHSRYWLFSFCPDVFYPQSSWLVTLETHFSLSPCQSLQAREASSLSLIYNFPGLLDGWLSHELISPGSPLLLCPVELIRGNSLAKSSNTTESSCCCEYSSRPVHGNRSTADTNMSRERILEMFFFFFFP